MLLTIFLCSGIEYKQGAWQTTITKLGPFVFKFGAFAGEAVNFVIVAFVIFIIAKIVLKKEKVEKI